MYANDLKHKVETGKERGGVRAADYEEKQFILEFLK